MKSPQTQEFPVHNPQIGQIGDCLRAGIASILDLPIATVPHFSQNCWPDQAETDKEVREFLANFGYFMIQLDYKTCAKLLKWQKEKFNIDCYHLITGIDFDGDGHVCVGLNGDIIHDPHPLRRGFADTPDKWHAVLFVALDPSQIDANSTGGFVPLNAN